MDLHSRLLIKKIPFAHEAGTRLLDLINEGYYRRADRRLHYTERIRELRGVHKGQRCFIVGNGPSLCSSDLDLIKDEVSFASNRIFEYFGETAWRPTFYFTQDVYDTCLRDYVEEISGIEAFVGAYFLRKHQIRNRQVVAYLGKKSAKSAGFSDNCAEMVVEMATVTFTMLQFAFYLGFDTIYLLGIDNTYRHVIDDANEVVTNNGVQDHFYPSTSNHVSVANVGQMTKAYEIANEAATRRGVQIINATRGGALEVYPRMTLEDALRPIS